MALQAGVPLRCSGRPSYLSSAQEDLLYKVVVGVKKQGAAVDLEMLQVMAADMQGVGNVNLTKAWARSFKKRHHLTNLRQCTSDRPDDTAEDVRQDNAWKCKIMDIIEHPSCNSIPWMTALPDALVLAVDETPLPYLPKSRSMVPATAQRRVALTSDKRCLTGTPVLSLAGEVVAFQIIFKGGTSRSEPKIVRGDPKLLFDHAPNKTQTRRTFQKLLDTIQEKTLEWKVKENMPKEAPALVIVDNANTHVTESCTIVPGGPLRMHKYKELYIVFINKCRSHTQNVGDQFVNRSLRQTIRRAAKQRITQHATRKELGIIPQDAKLDMGEKTMKLLLVEWVTLWLHNEHLRAWVHASWAAVLKSLPTSPCVDDVATSSSSILALPPCYAT